MNEKITNIKIEITKEEEYLKNLKNLIKENELKNSSIEEKIKEKENIIIMKKKRNLKKKKRNLI